MAAKEYRTHTTRPGIVGPIDKCIYGNDHSTADLSNEHVLPLGLSGGVLLTRASCADCRNKTSAFELICLRQSFGTVRAHQGMPTRRPSERPSVGKLIVGDGAKEEILDVPLSEHPNILALPEFTGIPAYITGNVTPPHIGMRMYGDVDEIRRRTALRAEANVSVGGRFDIDAFVRLLAKIGHGMMWASYDTGNIRPLLLPIILDGQTDTAWHLIGAGFRPMPTFSRDLGAGANMIKCEAVDVPNYGVAIVTTIQLFAEWGAPTYSVICGEADSEPARQMVQL